MDVFLYDTYRIQLKCKLCKDNNTCYENFHHISVSDSMDAFVHGIYKIQFKCKLCKETTFVMKIFIIFLFQSSWMPSFAVFVEFNIHLNCVKRQ